MCRSLWELLVNTLFEMLHQAWRSLSASVYALFLTIVASMEPPMRMARELCESVAAMPSRLCESVASLPSKLCECVPSMESFTRMPRELCESATTKASELSESVAAMARKLWELMTTMAITLWEYFTAPFRALLRWASSKAQEAEPSVDEHVQLEPFVDDDEFVDEVAKLLRENLDLGQVMPAAQVVEQGVVMLGLGEEVNGLARQTGRSLPRSLGRRASPLCERERAGGDGVEWDRRDGTQAVGVRRRDGTNAVGAHHHDGDRAVEALHRAVPRAVGFAFDLLDVGVELLDVGVELFYLGLLDLQLLPLHLALL